MRLFILSLVLLVAGCRSTTTGFMPTETPLLEQYAQRNGIPANDVQLIHDYAKQHGPALNAEELREFTAWQVK